MCEPTCPDDTGPPALVSAIGVGRARRNRKGELIPPKDVGGTLRQLLAQNKTDREEHRASGGNDKSGFPRREMDAPDRSTGNPAAPHDPEGCDARGFKLGGNRATQLFGATEACADEKDPRGLDASELSEDVATQEGSSNWYRPMGRQLPAPIEQFASNWLVLNSV